MRRTIDQFMWGFQGHFRSAFERDLERCFELIGFDTPMRVLLIGTAAVEGVRHHLCVEPETGPIPQSAFDDLDERSVLFQRQHPDYGMSFSDPRMRSLREVALIEEATSSAIDDILVELEPYGLNAWMTGRPVLINDYHVRVSVGVSRERLDVVPRVGIPVVERVYVGESLVHEVLRFALMSAYRSLHLPDPGAGLGAIAEPAASIVRQAAEFLMDGIPSRLLTYHGGQIMGSLDRISTTPYEGSGAVGRIRFATPTQARGPTVQLRNAIHLSNHRAVRKLLEATRAQTALLCDGRSIFALDSTEEQPASPCLDVHIHGRGKWSLKSDQLPAFHVEDGRAGLPAERLERTALGELVRRRLNVELIDDLWQVVEAASQAGHGTVLVITDSAADEAQRLAGQSTPIIPARLQPSAIDAITSLDGALMLDPEGVCHAIGVILDGTADGSGDPSRGARFNSSARYVASHDRTVGVVISEDGMIDLVPSLRARVSRQLVESFVQDLEASVAINADDGEPFGRAYQKVQQYEFYLTPEQCDRVQAAFDAVMDRRSIKIVREPFAPHPDMDEGYFSD